MASRFNTIYRGSAVDAGDEIDGGDYPRELTNEEMRAALTNAFRQIAQLQKDSHPPVTNVPDADELDKRLAEIDARLARLERLSHRHA